MSTSTRLSLGLTINLVLMALLGAWQAIAGTDEVVALLKEYPRVAIAITYAVAAANWAIRYFKTATPAASVITAYTS